MLEKALFLAWVALPSVSGKCHGCGGKGQRFEISQTSSGYSYCRFCGGDGRSHRNWREKLRWLANAIGDVDDLWHALSAFMMDWPKVARIVVFVVCAPFIIVLYPLSVAVAGIKHLVRS